MTVQITSWVPAYAGGESVTLVAPNIPGSNIGSNFTAVNDILIGTGLGTFTTATMGDILDGTYVPPSGPAGYSYNDLKLPTASLDVNSQFITNLLDPVNPQDAATKFYIDSLAGLIGGTFLPIAGGTMTGDLLTGAGVQILADFGSAFSPAVAFDTEPNTGIYRSAANEISFSNAAALGNPTLTIQADGTISVPTGYEALVVADGVIPNKKYVDDAIVSGGGALFLALVGGTMTGPVVFVGDRTSGQDYPYDNTASGLTATEVQDAIDELDTTIDGITGATYVNSFNTRTGAVVAVASDYDAIQIDFNPAASGLTATNVQAAIDELDTTIDGITGATYVNSFNTRTGPVVPLTSDYDAIQIDYDNSSSGLTAINTQAAIDEIDGRVDALEGAGPYLPLAGGTMVGVITFDAAQLFPYDNTATSITATDMQDAITELDIRVSNNESDLAGFPFLELAGGTMTGQIDHGALTAINLADPVNPQDAATMNYVDTEIGGLGLVGVGPYLPLSGGAMTGLITGLPTLTVGDHVLGASDYQSGLGGNSFLITTTAAVTSAAPTYSFVGATDMGMYSTGVALRFALGGADKLALTATGIDAKTNRIVNVADPILDQDAVTRKWVADQAIVRSLGSAFTIDLLAGAGTGTTILTVPTGKTQLYTQLVIRARSYIPGATPTNPVVSVGTAASSGLNVLASVTLDWGGIAGAADQALVIPLGVNGAPSATPNPGDIVQFKIQTPGGGTFTSLDVDVYLTGMEIPTP